MASTVDPLSGILHSDSISAGQTPRAAHVKANLQQNLDKINEVIVEHNLLTGEATDNASSVVVETAARLAADILIANVLVGSNDIDDYDDANSVEARISALESSGAGVREYGAGAATLQDSDLDYLVISKTGGGSVTLRSPSLYIGLDSGKQWSIINSDTSGLGFDVILNTSIHTEDPYIHIMPGESIVVRYHDDIWHVESSPLSPRVKEAVSGYTIEDEQAYQDFLVFYSGGVGNTISLPSLSSVTAGRVVTVTNTSSASVDVEVGIVGSETIVVAGSTPTSVTVSTGVTYRFIVIDSTRWALAS
jgi:hypothetical protein